MRYFIIIIVLIMLTALIVTLTLAGGDTSTTTCSFCGEPATDRVSILNGNYHTCGDCKGKLKDEIRETKRSRIEEEYPNVNWEED